MRTIGHTPRKLVIMFGVGWLSDLWVIAEIQPISTYLKSMLLGIVIVIHAVRPVLHWEV